MTILSTQSAPANGAAAPVPPDPTELDVVCSVYLEAQSDLCRAIEDLDQNEDRAEDRFLRSLVDDHRDSLRVRHRRLNRLAFEARGIDLAPEGTEQRPWQPFAIVTERFLLCVAPSWTEEGYGYDWTDLTVLPRLDILRLAAG